MEAASKEDFDLETETEQMGSALVEKAHELFTLCDPEGKGFITKREIKYLKKELSLSVEQLEDVFENLDQDCDGCVTLNEFTAGFGYHLGIETSNEELARQKSHNDEKSYESDEDEDSKFNEMLVKFEAQEMIRDHEEIRTMWVRLRKTEPELLAKFEEFLGKITNEMRRSQLDFSSLEKALRQKSNVYDQEVRTLYEEMEHQINQEKERILLEEKSRERRLREELELELQTKDGQLQELLSKHSMMETRLSQLNFTEAETKQENEKLLKEKEMLEKMLSQSEENLKSTKDYLDQLRLQEKQEKLDQAKAVINVTEEIAREQESLFRQLDLLRAMNRKLKDDKDELEIKKSWDSASTAGGTISPISTGSDMYSQKEVSEEDELEEGKEAKVAKYSESIKLTQPTGQQQTVDLKAISEKLLNLSDSNLSDVEMKEINLSRGNTIQRSDSETNDLSTEDHFTSEVRDFSLPTSPRAQPVGATSTATYYTDHHSTSNREVSPEDTPQRLFKVVFVGDSGVGKSSFIHRFCFDKFRPTFSATIGIDFQVKSIVAGNHIVAFQLWDTAGQERFRSITKQYFRKADGVIVMYDVTSESSFTNVRNWMTSIQEGAEPFVVTMLVGNKIDLCMNDQLRVVKKNDGTRLSDQYGALFYEASAKSGDHIKDAMHAMASLLRVREDQQMEKVLRLNEPLPKKKGCCN